MKPGYHEIYSRYRDNITRGVLKPGDKVIVSGLQKVRPGVTVKAEAERAAPAVQ